MNMKYSKIKSKELLLVKLNFFELNVLFHLLEINKRFK